MKCATCGNNIGSTSVSAAGKDFCSDVCHLRFWKDEMPNLGGRWITDEDIVKVEQLSGEDRKNEYARIVQFIMDNFDMTSLMLNIRYGQPPEDKQS